MKKLLSFVLAIALVFSGIIVTASAVETELTLDSEILCNYYGEALIYSFTPTEDVAALIYTTNASEGADTNVTVWRNDLDEPLGYADDNDQFLNFCYSATFEAGYTYTFEINDFYGAECQFTLVFKSSPIDHIEVTNIPVVSADFSGYYYFDYEGITVTIYYKDPNVEPKTVVCEESPYIQIDDSELVLEFCEDYEGNLELAVTYMGYTVEYEVITDKKNVVGFEFVSVPNSTILYEDIDTKTALYYDENIYDFISYKAYNVSFYGLIVRITYEDASYVDVSYEESPDFFQNLENDLHTQATNPWGVGKHTATFFFDEFSDSFEVEVVENPYVSAEITKLPDITENFFEGFGYFGYDENLERYFDYDTPLDGIEITLTDKNGEKKIIKNDLALFTNIHCETDQERNHWNVGQHEVEVFYGGMSVGTYTYTVTDMYISKVEMVTPSNCAFYYTNTDTKEFVPDSLVAKITLTNGSRTQTVTTSYENLMNSQFGTCIDYTIDYDDSSNNYYYYLNTTDYEHESSRVYFEKINDTVESLEVITPPACFDYIDSYGIDIYNFDCSGLEVLITMTDGTEYLWKWDESEKDGSEVFKDGVISASINGDFLQITYRDAEVRYSPENHKNISEYSEGVISKNTTLHLDFAKPGMFVYTFTPWADGNYNFTADGEMFTILGIFYEDGTLAYSTLFEEEILTNAENETYSLYCSKGDTYYLLVETLNIFGATQDSEIDFTVELELIGDVDGDTKITAKDVLMLRKSLGGAYTLTDEQKSYADCDQDGKITTKDVLCIRKYLGGIITKLPYITY